VSLWEREQQASLWEHEQQAPLTPSRHDLGPWRLLGRRSLALTTPW